MSTRSIAQLCLLLSFVLLMPSAGGGAELPGDILGIHLAMSKDATHRRLEEIGKFVRDERKRQEVWEVRDPAFSHVVVGFDAKDRVRYVTAVAREDKEAKRLKYTDIADTDNARQAGDPAIKNFNYEWTLPEKAKVPGIVIARGRDPEFLHTYSLKQVGAAEEE